MSWHPALGSPDPSAAWFTPDELAEIRRAEAIDRAIAHRNKFEQAVSELDNPTPEDINALWHHVDEESTDATD